MRQSGMISERARLLCSRQTAMSDISCKGWCQPDSPKRDWSAAQADERQERKSETRNHMDLLRESVERMSGGAVSLIPVPDELRISPQSLSALQEDMLEARRRNASVWSSSERHARGHR